MESIKFLDEPSKLTFKEFPLNPIIGSGIKEMPIEVSQSIERL